MAAMYCSLVDHGDFASILHTKHMEASGEEGRQLAAGREEAGDPWSRDLCYREEELVRNAEDSHAVADSREGAQKTGQGDRNFRELDCIKCILRWLCEEGKTNSSEILPARQRLS